MACRNHAFRVHRIHNRRIKALRKPGNLRTRIDRATAQHDQRTLSAGENGCSLRYGTGTRAGTGRQRKRGYFRIFQFRSDNVQRDLDMNRSRTLGGEHRKSSCHNFSEIMGAQKGMRENRTRLDELFLGGQFVKAPFPQPKLCTAIHR